MCGCSFVVVVVVDGVVIVVDFGVGIVVDGVVIVVDFGVGVVVVVVVFVVVVVVMASVTVDDGAMVVCSVEDGFDVSVDVLSDVSVCVVVGVLDTFGTDAVVILKLSERDIWFYQNSFGNAVLKKVWKHLD